MAGAAASPEPSVSPFPDLLLAIRLGGNEAGPTRLRYYPHPLRNAERDKGRLPLALDDETPLGSVRKYNQGYLPGLEPAASPVPPVSWLTLYDLTGAGPIQTRGRGAPLAQRLFVEVLTAVPIADRDPEWITAPPITLRDLFTWCWPRWHDRKANRRMRGGYNRAKHLEPLRRALLELDNIRIEYGRYERRLIRVDDLPTDATRLDDPIRFHIRHIPGSDRGPLIERTSVRRWVPRRTAPQSAWRTCGMMRRRATTAPASLQPVQRWRAAQVA